MTDKIEKLGNSTIQHGKFNNRIYLMKFKGEDSDQITGLLDNLATENNYTKIFAKIPSSALPLFIRNGYRMEATIPCFYNGEDDVYFMAKYFDNKRSDGNEDFLPILNNLLNDRKVNGWQQTDQGFHIKKLGQEHAPKASAIYKKVFETYPFPIHDPSYIKETMDEGTVEYFGVWHKDELIGLSSAEMDKENSNAEMTDFAVLPDYRGKKLAESLLVKMEEAMKKINIKTLYTIARLQSPGMNKTFINQHYKYSGTLINNTNISGNIESMNVFYKTL